MDRAALTLELARHAGFDLAGIAPLRPPRRAPEYREWLRAGRHGSMRWLEETVERVSDPRRLLPEGRSLLVVGLAHSRAPVVASGGERIARYAAGRDYHNVVGKRLKKLALRLRREGLAKEFKKVVDAGPLLERSHAAEAGVGFESKAANLLHPAFGPWFFLGELVLDVELEPTRPAALGSCGTCTACIDACPTGAIRSPGVVDARDCISYLTIEHEGAIDPALRPKVGEWLFGCDVCSEVCPWARRAPDLASRFGTSAAVERADAVEWIRAIDPVVDALEGSPLLRANRERLLRNAITFAGNRPRAGAEVVLLRALDDATSATIREAAGWSLARGYANERGVKDALERRAASDPDPEVRSGLRAWIAGAAGVATRSS